MMADRMAPETADQLCLGDISHGLCVDQTPSTVVVFVAVVLLGMAAMYWLVR